MKLSKKSLVLTLALTTAVISASSSAYANPDVQQSSVQNDLNSFKAVTAAAQQTLSFSFDLQNFKNSEYFTTSGGSIPITVVQWTNDPKGSPVMEYRLVHKFGTKPSQSVFINGTFTNVNTTRTFTGVEPGEYYILINNLGSYSVAGNGYVKYN